MGMSTKEGWGKPGNSRKWHYFGKDHRSLCSKFLWIGYHLDTGDDDSPDNCAACMRKLKEQKKVK